jgi:predicted  nucleic acid-binding Zn-ribbon protein
MADFTGVDTMSTKPKSFWQRPEGVTGTIFLVGVVGLLGWVVFTGLGTILAFASSLLGLVVTVLALGAIVYMALDPKMRALVGYMYKSVMRKITSIFVTIDPIGILKNYVDDLSDNLKKMGKQIGNLRGQMRKLKTMMMDNSKEINQNLLIAKKAKEMGNNQQLMLSSRKAARLKESNGKYEQLHSKMSILYKVLTKMYSNSEILLEDTKDQVKVKEQERKAIRMSHSAMKSAMNIISGDSDKRAMFDQAMEVIADDVANKVGEMEQFMELSANFMDSVDLQNGIFEEQGLKMLAEYEKKSSILLLGGEEAYDGESLDLNEYQAEKEKISGDSDYSNLFDS